MSRPSSVAPLAGKCATRQEPAYDANRHTARVGHATKILVAEDDPDMRRLIVTMLKHLGYDIAEVNSGTALLAYLGSVLMAPGEYGIVDLLIADVRMPGLSGLDVLAGLRAAGWDLPVILLTAFGDESVHLRAQRLGALAMFDKPFDLASLGELVRRTEPPFGGP